MDIQEAFRVLLDALNKTVELTPKIDTFKDIFQGVISNQIQCLTCSTIKENPEIFSDLILQVKGF